MNYFASKPPGPGSAASSGIDLAAIESLRGGSPDLWNRLVCIYLDSTPDGIKTLEQALTAEDSAAVHLAAHSPKSASANMGAIRLADLCQQIETAAGDKILESVPALFAKICSEYEVVSDQLAKDIEDETTTEPPTA